MGATASSPSGAFSRRGILAALGGVALGGCQTAPPAPPPAQAVTYRDVGSQGLVSGVGTESQDIVGLSDAMVRDLLASSFMAQLGRPPRILVDVEDFEARGQRIDRSLIVDRLRINLQRAARGRLLFVSREVIVQAERERQLKRSGGTDRGTVPLATAMAGVDYLMKGKMLTQDKRGASSGLVERFTQFSFELVEAETLLSVWANLYDFQKGGRDDAIYR